MLRKTLMLSGISLALLLAGCQTTQTTPLNGASRLAVEQMAASPQLRQDSFVSVYELAYMPQADAVWVTDVPSFEAGSAGLLHRLDSRSLQILQTVQLPKRAFGLALNAVTGKLYAGNTLDGGISVLDAASGQYGSYIQLSEAVLKDGETSYPHTRKIAIDPVHNRIFVTHPGESGRVWIIDGNTQQVLHQVDTGLWTAGAVYDPTEDRVYVGQGGKNEILAIDPSSGQIVQTISTGDSPSDKPSESAHFFVNLALDVEGRKLFAVDANTSQVYVYELGSGRLLQTVPLAGPGALDIAFHPQAQEIIVTRHGMQRGQPNGIGAVSIFDANSYQLKREITVPTHPNSVVLANDGQSVLLSVRSTKNKQHANWRPNSKDAVVRIDLE